MRYFCDIVKQALIFSACLFLLASCTPRLHERGGASYYADKFKGRRTASGEKFRQYKLTAAHKTLPFGTKVKVKNLDNGRTVKVRINDRGPFVSGRIIDLSKKAARRLGIIQSGTVKVEISYKKKRK
ncbi:MULTISPECIES: septal ring lytic transglycosylase RlpA family protein [Olivibacter]|uniref:Probable endolytic peptidoglycan transglycosylase RlpA n=2 Tax=Sphingobacteriaceae TaxID=84566 RepID=F4CDU5_SPHS2|nr:septal ring lytic transglycosylase RlpA family protein [Olivibacter sp. UJ_SKK_5.1]MDX3915830.1 septal ring lytic transglycosylase RlpA family protein [Pseudosphingobacterium sp.]